MVASLKSEMVSQITEVKKDLKKKATQKNSDLNKTRQEQEFAHDKLCEEIRVVKEKMTKLATQFDKELLDRDKALKQYQHGLWDDIQSLISAIQKENEQTRVMAHNIAASKLDKNELHEVRTKLAL